MGSPSTCTIIVVIISFIATLGLISFLQSLFNQDIINPPKSGCHWIGSAPFCSSKCPSGFRFIRNEPTSKCDFDWVLNATCNDGHAFKSYGEQCWLGQKSLCCKEGSVYDFSWSGTWFSLKTGNTMECSYQLQNSSSYCGELNCTYGKQSSYVSDLCEWDRKVTVLGRNLSYHRLYENVLWSDDDGKLEMVFMRLG